MLRDLSDRGPRLPVPDIGISPDHPAFRRVVSELLQLQSTYGLDVRDPAIQAAARKAGIARYEHERRQDQDYAARAVHVVYYALIGNLVKIGTTSNLTNRLRSYPPGTTVLATEDGSTRLEKHRLRQFADDLAERAEWFRLSDALLAHINSLRETPLTPAELAA